MPKWEYIYQERRSREMRKLMEDLNEAGEQGWEALTFEHVKRGISSDTIVVVFKRQVAVTE